MQLADGRIAYAPATLAGLVIYFAGALVGLWGGVLDHRISVAK